MRVRNRNYPDPVGVSDTKTQDGDGKETRLRTTECQRHGPTGVRGETRVTLEGRGPTTVHRIEDKSLSFSLTQRGYRSLQCVSSRDQRPNRRVGNRSVKTILSLYRSTPKTVIDPNTLRVRENPCGTHTVDYKRRSKNSSLLRPLLLTHCTT